MLTRLDLFLASHIAQQPGGDVARVGVDRQAADGVRRNAHGSVFRRVNAVSADGVKEFFGRPASEDYSQLVYPLSFLPAHHFVFGLQDGTLVVDARIAARTEPVLPVKLDRSLPAVREVLRPYVHTSDQVQVVLGLPDDDKSWYPAQAWYYRSADPRDSFTLNFCFGLLTSIDVPAADRGRGAA